MMKTMMMMMIRFFCLINLFFTPMLVNSISLKDCLKMRQYFIDQPLTIGTYGNDKYVVMVSKNLTMVNGSISALNHFLNMLTTDNKFMALDNVPKNGKILHAYVCQCTDEMIVTYQLPGGSLGKFSVNLLTFQVSTKGTPKKDIQPILSDCKNRTLNLKANGLFLLDPKKQLFKICVKKLSLVEDQLVMGSFGVTKCEDEIRTESFLANLKAAFFVVKHEKVYLLTKNSLHSVSSSLLTVHGKYFGLDSKNIYEWLNCGTGQSDWIEGNMKESDRFVSQAAGIIFIFFFLFSLLIFYYMFPKVDKKG